MDVLCLTLSLSYSSGSSWQSLTYVNPGIWNQADYAYLPSTGQTCLIENKIVNQPSLATDIRTLGHSEYLKILPNNNLFINWVLRHSDSQQSNPDANLNNEYIYNRNIDVYYQTNDQSSSISITRCTDQLPAPNNSQNDGGSGGDAGNNFWSATSINPGSYTGMLCNADPTDTEDWYQFWVDSGLACSVSMTPPQSIDFALQLYDPTHNLVASSDNGPGITDGVSCSSCQQGWWRTRIYRINGEAKYSFSVSVFELPPPPSCPYVSVWDGQRYVIDNNLLPTSLKNNGTEVQDYYRLEQALVPTYSNRLFSICNLKISEFEHEHSYIDQVNLLAIDHSADCNLAVTPEGQIVTYQQPQSPMSCIDNNGTDRLSQIQSIDGSISNTSTYFDGYKGDYLIINFSPIASQNAELILRSDRKCYDPGAQPPCCILVQIMNNSQWQTVSTIAPRENWATEAVNLSRYVTVGQMLVLRLYWTMPHRLDYVGLDTSPQETFEIHSATLIGAIHSTGGDVSWKLARDDGVCAELVPGQSMQLSFFILNNQNSNEERTFIFFTDGYYFTITP